jgi:hypothetical protein
MQWDDKAVRKKSRQTRIRSCVLATSSGWATCTRKRICEPPIFLWLGLPAEVAICGLCLPTSST